MKPHELRKSFTLVELLIVITIISILATSMLSALYGVIEDAKEARTRAQIAKLHELIWAKYESYRTRALNINLAVVPRSVPLGPELYIDANQNGIRDDSGGGESYTDRNGNNQYDALCIAFLRQVSLHDLMRMELPDRITDLTDTPIKVDYPNPPFGSAPYGNVFWGRRSPPSLWMAYRRRAGFTSMVPNSATWPASTAKPSAWTETHQGAECLYLIVSQIKDGDASALDFFTSTEIGDTDGDGYREILDGWGRPIEFLRWPAGFATQPGADAAWGVAGVDDDGNGTVDDLTDVGGVRSDDRTQLMIRQATMAPDPLNPFFAAPAGFAIYPLIFSAGRDGAYDIFTDDGASPFHYVMTGIPDNPYVWITQPSGVNFQLGKPLDANGNGDLEFGDNITNHSLVGT